MGFINWFGKNTKEQEHNINGEVQDGTEELAPYSGMKVEVTTLGGDLLFVAKLHGLRGDAAELHQYSETELSQESEPVRVKIRGYNDHERKAVHMEGVISPLPKHIWQVEELTVIKTGNDRAFFRLSTDLDATVTMFSGLEIGELKAPRHRACLCLLRIRQGLFALRNIAQNHIQTYLYLRHTPLHPLRSPLLIPGWKGLSNQLFDYHQII